MLFYNNRNSPWSPSLFPNTRHNYNHYVVVLRFPLLQCTKKEITESREAKKNNKFRNWANYKLSQRRTVAPQQPGLIRWRDSVSLYGMPSRIRRIISFAFYIASSVSLKSIFHWWSWNLVLHKKAKRLYSIIIVAATRLLVSSELWNCS